MIGVGHLGNLEGLCSRVSMLTLAFCLFFFVKNNINVYVHAALAPGAAATFKASPLFDAATPLPPGAELEKTALRPERWKQDK